MREVVGFVGCYSHDVILMLAKTIGCLGKKVLVRDRNKQRTLQASVPIPEGVCLTNALVEYDSFYFTGQTGNVVTEEAYDIEIVDFGMNVDAEELTECSCLILITDMLLHHIRRLTEIGIPKEKVKVCVIRDSFEDVCRKDPEMKVFLQSFPNQKEYFLPPDFKDIRNRYVCETLHEYNLNKASAEMKDMLYGLVEMFCHEYSGKEIRRNVRNRERRRYR